MREPDKTGLRLILLGSSPTDDPIGIAAAPPYLTADVLRWPGETVEQLCARALALARGNGAVATRLLYAPTRRAPRCTDLCAKGTSQHLKMRVRNDREISLVDRGFTLLTNYGT